MVARGGYWCRRTSDPGLLLARFLIAEKNMKNTFSSKNGLNADLRSIDSIYRMIVVAGLRSKQLLRGAAPKIVADPTRQRNISIALEEARQGLINYKVRQKPDASTPAHVGVSSQTESKELNA